MPCVTDLFCNSHFQSLALLPCSGKLSREKTFVNFAVLWLFAKVFSWNFRGVAFFGVAKASNPRKFSPSKVSCYTVCFNSCTKKKKQPWPGNFFFSGKWCLIPLTSTAPREVGQSQNQNHYHPGELRGLPESNCGLIVQDTDSSLISRPLFHLCCFQCSKGLDVYSWMFCHNIADELLSVINLVHFTSAWSATLTDMIESSKGGRELKKLFAFVLGWRVRCKAAAPVSTLVN